MADQPAKPAKKRRVRNPETFRERAIKASEAPSKEGRGLKASATKAASPLKPVGRQAARLGRVKPLRLVGRILLPRYLRNSWQELRKVEWPSRRESFRLTFAVLVFAAIFGAAIAVVDLGLDKVFRNILLK